MKKMMALALIVFIGSNFFGNSLLNVMAEEPEVPPRTRYYQSILIEDGDSLWSISKKYMGDDPADYNMSIQEYIDQLKQINGLSEDTIHAGQYLTVVY
ncbi:MAG: LysM peptidoglycan-binding domain-containing protein [Hungatella sp.]